MIESSIEELFNSINNSNEYKEYKLIVNTLESNKEVIDLIEEIKKLQKEAVNLEYKNDDRYLELDKLIKEKEKILNIKKKVTGMQQFSPNSDAVAEEHWNNGFLPYLQKYDNVLPLVYKSDFPKQQL